MVILKGEGVSEKAPDAAAEAALARAAATGADDAAENGTYINGPGWEFTEAERLPKQCSNGLN